MNTSTKMQGFHAAETMNAVPTPPSTGELKPVPSVYDCLNGMLETKMVTAIIKKQKMQYSIVGFRDYNNEWMLCEVENLAGSVPGDDLLILVQKTTPIVLYFSGAVKSPFS